MLKIACAKMPIYFQKISEYSVPRPYWGVGAARSQTLSLRPYTHPLLLRAKGNRKECLNAEKDRSLAAGRRRQRVSVSVQEAGDRRFSRTA